MRTGGSAARAGAPAKEAEPPKPKAEPKEERKPRPKAERKPERKTETKPQAKPERSPVVEDIKSDWNGPLPGFLSKSAG